MFARKGVFSSVGRVSAAATLVAVALTTVAPSMAFAAGSSGNGVTTGTSGATDISARRYYRGGGAAAAAVAGIVGTGLAIAATQGRRDYYDSYGYYDPAPTYYYGGGPSYGYGYGGGGNRHPGGYNNPNAAYNGW